MSSDDDDGISDSEVESDVSDVLAPPETKALPKRSTRGTRLGTLAGEDAEADAAFWEQDAWNADDSDFDLDNEKVAKDKFDSDFNDTEESDNEVFDNEGVDKQRNVERQGQNRSSAYKEPAKPRLKKRKAPDSSGAGPSSGGGDRNLRAPMPASNRSLRKSTTSASGAARKKLSAVVSKKITRRAKPEVARFTQEQLLDAAVGYEAESLKALERQMRSAAETEKRALPKEAAMGSLRRYHSKKGCAETITFIGEGAMPAVLTQTAVPPPPRAVCAVTGQPARYKDPLTGQPYATLQAFRELRKRHSRQQARQNAAAGAAQ